MALGIHDLQAILDINRKINSIEDVKSILQDISHYAGILLNAEGASILLVDQQTGNLHFEVAFGESADALYDMVVPKGKGLAGYVAETKQYIIVNDAEKDKRFYSDIDKKTNLKTKNLMAMPLIHKEQTIGVIEVINPKRGIFTEDDVVLLTQFAEQAATAIANALLYREIHDKANELEYLFNISNLTNQIYDMKDLFSEIVVLLSSAFNSARVSIMLINEQTGKLYVESSLGIEPDIIAKIENSINVEKISSKVVNLGMVIFANDIEKAGIGRNKKLRYSRPSFLSVPIRSKNMPIGVINISEPRSGTRYTQEMTRTLQTIANQVGHAYESIKSYIERIEHEKIRKEVDIMKMLQNALLINDFSDYKNVSVFAKMKPADIVGGDFYDIYKFSPFKIGFVIGDVSGKGLPASLYMAVSRSVIKAYAFQMDNPEKLLAAANNVLVDDSRVGMFVTMFYGLLDLEKGILEYANAGHNQQYVYKIRKGDFIPLASRGIPLGISGSEAYQTSQIALDSGDIIFAFTDGVTDAVNQKGEDFGLQRLHKVVKDYSAMSAPTLVNSIIREVEAWSSGTSQWDDITIVVFKIP